MDLISEINKLREFYKLKSIYRFNSVDNRKESSAEHSWSCLILADFFLSKCDLKINRLKVFELLIYHDVVEIETGDFPLHPNIERIDKNNKERFAAEVLKNKFPEDLNSKFFNLFKEFQEQKTIESRFAKAIDSLDAEIHELDYKEDWKGWTEEFLTKSKSKFFEEFPLLKETFFKLIEFEREKGYFDN